VLRHDCSPPESRRFARHCQTPLPFGDGPLGHAAFPADFGERRADGEAPCSGSPVCRRSTDNDQFAQGLLVHALDGRGFANVGPAFPLSFSSLTCHDYGNGTIGCRSVSVLSILVSWRSSADSGKGGPTQIADRWTCG